MASRPLLQVRGLTIHYEGMGEGLEAVKDVDLEIFPGEIVGILGGSGCGKTSLALSMLGLLPPEGHISSGSIRFADRELTTLRQHDLQEIRGSHISLIFQEPSAALNPVMRAGGQIAEVIRAHRKWPRKPCLEEAEAVLARLHFADVKRICRVFPHQLSGGQRQRIVIGQALACRPRLLIADEPTAALDSTTQAEVLRLLKEVAVTQGVAMLFISHNPAILHAIAARILVMQAGRIVDTGDVSELFSRPSHPYTRNLLGAMAWAGRSKS